MIDPELAAWFSAKPARMRAFDALANRYGQSIMAAMAPAGFGFDDCVLIAYATGEPIGSILPDGHVDLTPAA